MAVRPHRHAPRWRASPCACRADARRHSITRLHVAWFPRDRVRACRWSSPATDGFRRLVAVLSITSQQGGAASCRAAVCPPPRPAAAPASAGRPQRRRFALGWGRRSVSRGPAALQTRRCTHARGIPARSRPPDSHRHPKPCAAPPCSSLRSCGAASRRTAQGLPWGELRPARSVAASGSVRQSPAQRATAPPPATPGVPKGKRRPRTQPIRRAPTLATSGYHPQRRFL